MLPFPGFARPASPPPACGAVPADERPPREAGPAGADRQAAHTRHAVPPRRPAAPGGATPPRRAAGVVHQDGGTETYRFGEVEIRVEAREVRRGGRRVPLTLKQYEVLLLLARGAGRVVAREELYAGVWGDAPPAGSRTLDVHVAELRRKLEDEPRRPRHIVTIPKVGYRLDP